MASANFDNLAGAITTEEVLAAINQLNRGQTCGPDRLLNEVYMHHEDVMAPALTYLFNAILKLNQIPASFSRTLYQKSAQTCHWTGLQTYRTAKLGLYDIHKTISKAIASAHGEFDSRVTKWIRAWKIDS